jgi:hypothetical protein
MTPSRRASDHRPSRRVMVALRRVLPPVAYVLLVIGAFGAAVALEHQDRDRLRAAELAACKRVKIVRAEGNTIAAVSQSLARARARVHEEVLACQRDNLVRGVVLLNLRANKAATSACRTGAPPRWSPSLTAGAPTARVTDCLPRSLPASRPGFLTGSRPGASRPSSATAPSASRTP